MGNEKIKGIIRSFTGQDTVDGAGVKLKRIFGGRASASLTDPFLLLDHFGSSRVEDYEMGFPWHPHRGIETVTYLLAGKVLHEDSEGHRGVIRTNDIQWMTGGSGIFHQEMPRPLDAADPDELLKAVGLLTNVSGFQLWINLPAKHKMTKPTYRDIKDKYAPILTSDGGAVVKVISGDYAGTSGPVRNAYGIDTSYLDVSMPEETDFTFPVKPGHNSLLYMIGGRADTGSGGGTTIEAGQAVVFSQHGDFVKVRATEGDARFLLLSGKPLGEPIWWYGPIVMNTSEQIEEAAMDLRMGTFIRDRDAVIES